MVPKVIQYQQNLKFDENEKLRELKEIVLSKMTQVEPEKEREVV